MSIPSLLLVPARLKDGTLFSQIPTSGAGDFTVVQAVGNATRVNSSGFVESARTNLILQSENFATTWTTSNLSFVTGQTSNFATPNGATNAYFFTESTDSVASEHRIQQSGIGSVVSGTTYTVSIFAKAASVRNMRFALSTAVFVGSPVAVFNLNSGTVVFTQNSTAQIQSYGNDWYRCSMTAVCDANGTSVLLIQSASGTSQTYIGNGSSAFYLYGAQFEAGPSASDYIPTTTVARTKFSGVTVNGTSIANIPRLDYYTSSGTPGCPGLLVEASGSNLLLQSAGFEVSGTWSPTNITVTTGSTAAFTAPDGTTSADLLTASASGSARIIQSFTFVSGTTYSYSAFAKAGSGFFGLTMENGGVASGAAVIWNLNTGALAVSGTAGAGYTLQSQGIENYGNGWYRCRMTVLLGLGVAGSIRANTSNGTMISAVIQSASGNTAYVWGAQLEVGSVPTSYIPTTTGSVTRNADIISASGNVSGSIGQTEGSIYAEVNIQKLLGTTQRAIVDIGQAGNRLFLGYGNGLTDQIRFLLQTSGGGLVDFQSATTTTGTIRIAVGYKNSDSAMYVNGVKVSPVSNGSFTSTLTSLSNIYLGSSLSGADFLNDRINAVALYATRLSDDALMLLSMQGNDAYLPQAIWNFYEDSRTGNTEVPTCLYERHADIIDV